MYSFPISFNSAVQHTAPARARVSIMYIVYTVKNIVLQPFISQISTLYLRLHLGNWITHLLVNTQLITLGYHEYIDMY